jgi:CheY-like chemotaxis protein
MGNSTRVTPFTALIVDDNWYNRDLVKLALNHVGYEVAEANDGFEALNMLERQTFDLLVLDLAMPGMNGASVLRTLRLNARHAKMRVIVMTANPHMAAGEVEDGADFVMFKPIDVQQFSRFAKRLIEITPDVGSPAGK